MRKERKNYTGAQKMAILRAHLIEKVPLSELCEKYHLQPTVFYQWQKKLFEEGATIFDSGRRSFKRHQDVQTRTITALQEKLRTKNDVLAELMEEHVALKKELGEP